MTKLQSCFLVSAALLLGLPPQPSNAQIKPCGELKAEITAKLKAKGVKSYTLTIIENAAVAVASGKVVGSCENGTKKIMYARQLRSKAGMANKSKPVVVVLPDPPPASAPDVVAEDSPDSINWEELEKEWGQCGGESSDTANSCGE